MVTLSSRNPYNFSLISHTYFHGYKYDVLGIKYETLEYWTPKKGFDNGLDIYYDKTLNVYGKKFWFGLIEYPPYAIIIPEGDNKFRYDGLETRIAAMYVDIHNGTWDAFDHPNLFWGDVHEDGHADGILGSVMYHRADFGFAAVYQWHCDAVACSYPYVYAAITCMVPRPHRKSGWLTVILPFTPRTWIGFTCVYLISSLFVFGMMTFKARVLGMLWRLYLMVFSLMQRFVIFCFCRGSSIQKDNAWDGAIRSFLQYFSVAIGTSAENSCQERFRRILL